MIQLFLFTICDTRNAISHDKRFVLANQHVCSVDYGSSSYISLMCLLPMLLRYFLNDSDMVFPNVTGITFVFAFHMRCISVANILGFFLDHFSGS